MKKAGKKEIKQALINNNGFVINAAQELGISRLTLKKYIDEDDDLVQTMKDCKESLKDIAEGQLLKNIKEGKETSLLFFMKTQMKDRGYGQDISDAAMTFNQLNITVNTEDTKLLIDDIIKKISNE